MVEIAEHTKYWGYGFENLFPFVSRTLVALKHCDS